MYQEWRKGGADRCIAFSPGSVFSYINEEYVDLPQCILYEYKK